MISSASDGIPLRPSRALTIPSFIEPPCASVELLAVIDDGNAEGLRVVERRAHQVRTDDRAPVIAYRHRAGGHHLAELRERLALLPHRDRADRIHARLPRPCSPDE